MAVESKSAEQKLQKMEDSRRKNEKMAKQVEKVLTELLYLFQVYLMVFNLHVECLVLWGLNLIFPFLCVASTKIYRMQEEVCESKE